MKEIAFGFIFLALMEIVIVAVVLGLLVIAYLVLWFISFIFEKVVNLFT